MNGLEEIQEIIKNFIYEKQQTKQQIVEIEGKRAELAIERNEKKKVNENPENAYANNSGAEINELGKQITELGNQSQELQNKLDSMFNDVKKQVNLIIDNLIAEGIRKVRKIEDEKQELQQKIELQEAKNAKYEIQKQEFFERFGRMPELSENARQENEIRLKECEAIKIAISEIEAKLKINEEEITELAKTKREFKNGNIAAIIKTEEVQEVVETNTIEEIQNVEEIVCVEDSVIEETSIEEQAVEEVITENIEQIEEAEESITLPMMEVENVEIVEKIVEEPIIEEVQVQEVSHVEESQEEIQVIEEIKIEDVEPIEEISVEEFATVEEVQIEEFTPVEEIQIEEFAPIEEFKVEEIEPIEEIQVEEISVEPVTSVEEIKVQEFVAAEDDEIAQIAKAIVEEIAEEQSKDLNNSQIEQNKEQEIITFEEHEEKNEDIKATIPSFGEKVILSNVIAKLENGDVVYKALTSNGDEIKIYPRKAAAGNLLLKDKENREELKEILINYAVAEYKMLDKKVIKKIDPIVCEILVEFAKKYNYDAQNLIFNYAMSFSKNEESESELIPAITYNLYYLENTILSKKEKDILTKICKNAKKNDKIDIIGCTTGLSRIRYILRRTFNTNNANALPEAKY